ncbi:MAG: hypothetical protein AB7Q27_17455 [Acidimicrobiia bacterium]
MKRYRNRLQRVLDVRRIQEERARAQLQRANNAETLARQVAEAKRERYREHQPLVGPVAFVHHNIDRSLYELRALAVLEADERIVEAHAQVEQRLGEWAAAAQKVEALERLDGRRRVEHAVEADRAEARELDDMVTGRAGRAEREDDQR